MRDRTYAITARDEAFLAVCAYLAVAIFHEMNITSKHHEAQGRSDQNPATIS